jgi:uncharacterized metal-binding protein YceD (DUF177 family)
MNAFAPYAIPIQGLKVGPHHFHFDLDQSFFAHFEDSPIAESALAFSVQLDKRPDMLLFDFTLEGHVGAECDRCTANIHLPVADERQLIVKYGEDEGEAEDEVVFIHRETSVFNLAPYLYEFAVLALPIRNIYDCQRGPNPPCNREVLDFLEKEEAERQKPSAVWDALKDFKSDN